MKIRDWGETVEILDDEYGSVVVPVAQLPELIAELSRLIPVGADADRYDEAAQLKHDG